MKNNNKNIKQSIYWNYTSSVIIHTIALLTSATLLKLLSPNDFGVLAILFLVLGLGSIFIGQGYVSAIIREKIIPYTFDDIQCRLITTNKSLDFSNNKNITLPVIEELSNEDELEETYIPINTMVDSPISKSYIPMTPLNRYSDIFINNIMGRSIRCTGRCLLNHCHQTDKLNDLIRDYLSLIFLISLIYFLFFNNFKLLP